VKSKGSGIVYSSEFGRMCPDCDAPVASCQCKAAKDAAPAGDGIVRLRLETKGRGGKAVTTLTGVPLPAVELAALTKELKRQCGTGGTLKGSVIEIQGDHRDGVEAELLKRQFRVKRVGG